MSPQSIRGFSRLFLVVIAFSLSGIPGVFAQSKALEEIVVTARKRAESLQDIPASVTAFNAELVEQAGIVSMRDYVSMTSNMNLMETQNIGFAFVNIRGLSTIRNVDPAVALVVDGVLATNSLSFSQDMHDIQQIEVLKGPQGALYGRNATGGAIVVTTKEPDNEVRGHVKAGYGNGDNKNFVGALSGPLVEDSLLGQVTVSYQDADGWRDNVATGGKADPYEDLSVRSKLIWNAADNLKVDLRFSYSETESFGSQFVSNAPNFVNAPNFPANAHFPGNGSADPVDGLPASITSLIGDPNNTSIKHQGNEPGADDREAFVFSAKVDWETDFGTITSVTSYDELDHITAGEQFAYYPFIEVAGTPGAGTHPAGVVVPAFAAPLAFPGTGFNATFGQNRFHEAFSQELRITSASDQKLRWIVGGYLVDTKLDVMISTNDEFGQGVELQGTEPNIGGINPTIDWNSRFIAPLAPIPGVGFPGAVALNPNTNPGALAYNLDHNDNLAYAVFGQLNYDLTSNIELSFALRYDRDERELTIGTPQEFLPVFPNIEGEAEEGDVRERSFDSLQPKATIRWQPRDNLTVYGSYGEGFRSGGFNLSGVSAGVNTLDAAGVPGLPQGVEDSFEQEDTESFEIGFKSSFDGGQLGLFRVNGSAFYTEVDNAFTFVFVAPFTAQTTRNIEEAEILGGELAASWIPNDNLQMDMSFGVLDSEIKKSSWVGAGGIDIVGNKLPQNPDTTLNFGLSYNRPITDTLHGFFRFDYRRLGEMFFAPENFAVRDSINLFDMRGGLRMNNGLEIVGWVDNLTDKDYVAEEANPNGITFYNKARRYGVELVYRF